MSEETTNAAPSETPEASTENPIGTQQIKFKKGRTIYEEGADADGAYLLIDGEVELFRQVKGAFHQLGIIGDGNIFGESSVIQRETRSTTTRAKTDVTCLFIEAKALRNAISDPLINLLFRNMSARLADRYVPERTLLKNNDVKVSETREKKKRHTGIPELEGVTPLVVEKLSGKIKITQFPFHIGNTRSYGELAQLSDQSLMMPLPSAPDLDSKHLEFIKRGSDILVRDLGSPAGTVVNGNIIKKGSKSFEAILEVGENIIGTGGTKSKVTFVVTLREVG